MSATEADLAATYADGPDPWGFRTSAYEAAKFAATRAALPRARYRSGLEIGCGNGELARRLAPLCDAYTGLDAVETALAEARLAVPGARFVRAFLPCPLPPPVTYDLVVLSEILYFLDPAGIADLARQIPPAADVLCVTWLGATGYALTGEATLEVLTGILAAGFSFARVAATDRYRIDVGRSRLG